MKVHKIFVDILDEFNRENLSSFEDDIEDIIRKNLEQALTFSSYEIENKYKMSGVVVTADIKQVSIHITQN
jgi:hypothetical protein